MKSRSKKNTQQKNLEVLQEVIEAASNTFDLKQILSNIVKILAEISKSDSCFIYLITGDEVILKASQNPHQNLDIRMKVGEGITGWVAETKKSVAISNHAYEDKRFKLFNNLPEDYFEAFLSIPIVFRSKVIGVINIQHKQKHRYPKQEIHFLETLAKQIGGILEVSRLISETNMLKEALETQKLINKAKAILMKSANISEDQAHKLLLKKSMDKRKSLREIAEAVILADEF